MCTLFVIVHIMCTFFVMLTLRTLMCTFYIMFTYVTFGN